MDDLSTTSPALREAPPRRNRLMIKSGGRIHFVRMTDIDWCEAAGNYVRIHVAHQEHLVRDTMSRLETELDPLQFVRIHRSTIVNVDRIQEMQSSFNGEYVVLLRTGTRLTLSRGYRDSLQATTRQADIKTVRGAKCAVRGCRARVRSVRRALGAGCRSAECAVL